MPKTTLIRRPHQAPRALVWLLLAALLMQAGAAIWAQVLGRAHTHQPVAAHAPAGPGWIDGLLAWRASKLTELQAAGVFRHAAAHVDTHSHDSLERHHHGITDASVQTLDGASEADSATATAAAPPWGPATQPRPLLPVVTAGPWPASLSLRWSSALPSLPERPPRA
jgi:hypothetical protein